MSTIQIRNVPEDFHRRLKVRAAERGQTLSDYLLEELLANADKPTLAEWGRMVMEMERPQRDLGVSVSEILAQERKF